MQPSLAPNCVQSKVEFTADSASLQGVRALALRAATQTLFPLPFRTQPEAGQRRAFQSAAVESRSHSADDCSFHFCAIGVYTRAGFFRGRRHGRHRRHARGGNDAVDQDLPEPPDCHQRRVAQHRTGPCARPAWSQWGREDDAVAPGSRPAPTHRWHSESLRPPHDAEFRRPPPPDRLHSDQPAVPARHDANFLPRLHGPALRLAARRAQAAARVADPGRRSAERLRRPDRRAFPTA